MAEPLKVFIGWDKREPEAFDVASASLMRHATIPVTVEAIKLDELRSRNLYWRTEDPLATTEFTYSRFLVPCLAGYKGKALFFDCDFLWLGDVKGLLDQAKDDKAVYCVHHDYTPKEATKMDGKTQTVYPRKNWSSLMLFNAEHPACKSLTPEIVNTQTGAYLHRMQWVDDASIGELPVEWNWLEGWNTKPETGTPKAVHFTRGGPWFKEWQNVDYGDLWKAEYARLARQ